MKLKTVFAFAVSVALAGRAANAQALPNLLPLPNASGLLETYNIHDAPISLKGALFSIPGNERPLLLDVPPARRGLERVRQRDPAALSAHPRPGPYFSNQRRLELRSQHRYLDF